jgi:NAD(P)-dependent dehydrogenase (short-subunit alcohol dehydrogenase family)
MKQALILGLGSDIAKNIAQRLIAEGWSVSGTARTSCDFSKNESIDRAVMLISQPWDLLLVCVGTLVPIGKFSGIHPDDWEQCVRINALGPLRMFYHLLEHRRPEASAVFFSGTNPIKRNPLYSAYSASKALLVRAVEEIDAELDIKCFCIAPGFVKTKIQNCHDVANRGEGTDHQDIYDCLKHSIARPKSEIGGKTIHVPTWATVFKDMA